MTIEYFWFEAIVILALIFANGFFAASEIESCASVNMLFLAIEYPLDAWSQPDRL